MTLVETVIVLTLVGLVTLAVAPRVGNWMDSLAVRGAADEIAGFYSAARFGALLRGTRVRIELTPDSLRAIYEGAADSLFMRQEGPSRSGVSLSTSRLILRILPNGLGAGGSNTTLVLRRGVQAESLTTSRLGRLKRWR